MISKRPISILVNRYNLSMINNIIHFQSMALSKHRWLFVDKHRFHVFVSISIDVFDDGTVSVGKESYWIDFLVWIDWIDWKHIFLSIESRVIGFSSNRMSWRARSRKLLMLVETGFQDWIAALGNLEWVHWVSFFLLPSIFYIRAVCSYCPWLPMHCL